jgi:hypothetical protein
LRDFEIVLVTGLSVVQWGDRAGVWEGGVRVAVPGTADRARFGAEPWVAARPRVLSVGRGYHKRRAYVRARGRRSEWWRSPRLQR